MRLGQVTKLDKRNKTTVSLSGRFHGIVSLVFSEFWHGARNSYKVMRHRAIFCCVQTQIPYLGKFCF